MKRSRRKERPLWKPRSQQPGYTRGDVVVIKGREARELKELRAELRGRPQALAGKTQRAPVAAPIQPRAFRFRYQLSTLAWPAGAAMGLAAHKVDAWALALVLYPVAVLTIMLFTRSALPFARSHVRSFAWWMTAAGIMSAVWGVNRPADIAALLAWLLLTWRWCHHYGWRPVHPKAPALTVDTSAQAIWQRLAEQRKWSAHLGAPREIENGKQYTVVCDGALTHIDQIMAQPQAVAAAFDAPTTEAYVEPDPSGIKSRGMFTRLRSGTLDTPREWAGGTIDPATGLAVIGRFPDGKPVRERYFIRPSDGVKHTLITGCDGSGKTGTIDLGLCISAASGIICPVILDPQMGQALPAWRDHVTYAAGPEQCMTYLRALHGTMMDRSEYLGGVRWCKEHGVFLNQCRPGCKVRRGMGFFDPFLNGLPIIEITIDESPVLLAMKGAVQLVLDLGKLGRKAGFRLRLAAQVPSMKEMGATELRSILVGGNVICLRAGDKVSGNMVNIQAPPWELPKIFRDGSPTYGLGYASTVDGRAASPMRTDWVPDPYEVAETTQIRQMDDRAAAKMAELIAAEDATAAQLQQAADSAARVTLSVLAVLRREPMNLGELIAACQAQEIPMSAVTDAVRQLQADGDVRQDGTLLRVVTR